MSSVTSSPGLAAGLLPFDWPDGPKTDPSGPAVVLASRSVSPAGGRGSKIQGIYGPTFIDSSVHPGPLSLWGSRLRERLATLGSPEWDLIWRRKAMPGGRSISRLAPSERRTAGTGCTGWPTPQERDYRTGEGHRWQTPEERSRNLNDAVAFVSGYKMAGWPFPMAGSPATETYNEAGNTDSSRKTVEIAKSLAGWKTPLIPSGGRRNPPGTTLTGKRPDGKKVTVDLRQEAEALAGWTTPQAHDTAPGNSARIGRHGTKHGDRNLNDEAALISGLPAPLSDPTPKVNTGALNPEFVSWLMGFPPEWLSYAPSATRSARPSRRKS